MRETFYVRVGKRCLDAACSAIGIVFLTPLFAFVAMAVKLSSAGPVFFRQVRTGQFEKPFRIFKFRTMRIGEPEGPGALLTAAGDCRITRVGAWLRKTKIDELPQLFNVLLGQMSLVGPRPEVPRYTAKFDERQKQMFRAKPGITGPSANAYEEELMASHPDKEYFYLSTVMPAKLEIDLVYCQNIGLTQDLQLVFSTCSTVLRRILEAARLLPDSAAERTALHKRQASSEGRSV
jgi:lipopolysaccharide/colanic/teichoic acid biosynthesis glycosyltransferase